MAGCRCDTAKRWCSTNVALHHVREMQARLQYLTCEEVRENMAIIGTPEHSIERITWLREEFQLGELICWFTPGGLMPAETILTSMNRFATHVMLHFRCGPYPILETVSPIGSESSSGVSAIYRRSAEASPHQRGGAICWRESVPR
jgi:hypothetical protein